MTHRLLVRVVLVVVGEQVDAEADAPGHGEEGDAPPLLHVSCAVAGGKGGRVRSVSGVRCAPLCMGVQSAWGKETSTGRPGVPARDGRRRRYRPFGHRGFPH